jgi:proton-translocating NADH-quinone oxidoreductase chain N
MVSASDLVTLYLGLELQSFALYLIAASAGSALALTGALRYFFVGSLGSTLLLVGVGITYATTGTTSFSGLSALMSVSTAGEQAGLALVVAGLLFKIAAAPMHTWAAQVYESARYPIGVWLMVMPKLSIVTVLVLNPWVPNMLRLAALASLIVGCLVGLVQDRIKRLLTYSAVSHVGFLLMCSDPASALFYLAIYSATVVLSFLVLDAFGVDRRALLAGGLRSQPGLAVALIVALFSMAGVPPLAGFYAKFTVLGGALAEGSTILAFLGILSSVVSGFFYLRLVAHLAEARSSVPAAITAVPAYCTATLASALVLFGLNPEFIMTTAALLC